MTFTVTAVKIFAPFITCVKIISIQFEVHLQVQI